MKVPFYLRSAVEEAFGPDPYLDKPNEQTVEAVASFVLWAAKVSKARRKSLANEPWKVKLPERHLAHAEAHLHASQAAIKAENPAFHVDREDGLPELAHAGLRIAFALWLLREEFVE